MGPICDGIGVWKIAITICTPWHTSAMQFFNVHHGIVEVTIPFTFMIMIPVYQESRSADDLRLREERVGSRDPKKTFWQAIHVSIYPVSHYMSEMNICLSRKFRICNKTSGTIICRADAELTRFYGHIDTAFIVQVSPNQWIDCFWVQNIELGILANPAKLRIKIYCPPQHHWASCFFNQPITAWQNVFV